MLDISGNLAWTFKFVGNSFQGFLNVALGFEFDWKVLENLGFLFFYERKLVHRSNWLRRLSVSHETEDKHFVFFIKGFIDEF